MLLGNWYLPKGGNTDRKHCLKGYPKVTSKLFKLGFKWFITQHYLLFSSEKLNGDKGVERKKNHLC